MAKVQGRHEGSCAHHVADGEYRGLSGAAPVGGRNGGLDSNPSDALKDSFARARVREMLGSKTDDEVRFDSSRRPAAKVQGRMRIPAPTM